MLELLAAIGIAVLLLSIMVSAASKIRRASNSVMCLSNLQSIGMAFRQYATVNRGVLPDPFKTHKSWEASLSSFAGMSGVFVCPADTEVAPGVGSSYDWRDTGNAVTTLAGKPYDYATRSTAVLAFDALPGWHGRKTIHAVTVSGAASAMSEHDCFADLAVAPR